ncbi:MAG TPA: hypothetical protein PKJ63_01410 [Cyclobacteriaceae bacterium]|nr:hypothetical protein [Cyclobacteriaceae bacterium]
MRLIVFHLLLVSLPAWSQNDKKFIVVTVTQTDDALVIYSGVNIAGGTMKLQKLDAESVGRDFGNVSEILNYLDDFGYDLNNVAVLGDRKFTERQRDGSRTEGTWYIVQYTFKLRSDKVYPVLKI